MVMIAAGLLADIVCAESPEKELTTHTLRAMARSYLTFGKYGQARILASQALQQARDSKTDKGIGLISD